MDPKIYVPRTLRDAGKQIRLALHNNISTLSAQQFVRAWCGIAYLFPGLHPDGYEDADSGWPRVLRCFAAEAWRRADAGELNDEALYPSDAAWAGLYDRMHTHEPDEKERRLALAAEYGNEIAE